MFESRATNESFNCIFVYFSVRSNTPSATEQRSNTSDRSTTSPDSAAAVSLLTQLANVLTDRDHVTARPRDPVEVELT